MSLQTSFMPTQEEAFDFFTRVWEPEPEVKKDEPEKDTEEPKEGPSQDRGAGDEVSSES